jgi:hypothetical protein
LRSRTSFILLGFLIAGCATEPPSLPADYGSVKPSEKLQAGQFAADDLRLGCDAIGNEIDQIKQRQDRIEDGIRAERGRNQAIGFVSAWFPPLLFAAENQTPQKEEYASLQARIDTVVALSRYKKC